MRNFQDSVDPMSEEEIEQKLAHLAELARKVDHRVSRTRLNEAISELLNEIDNLENDQ
ncbi:hypothetical protein VSR69_45430 [Paraburkholderia phytofirmans]|jgi:hypothetical protein|uniref:hypothetical protein n=1 Tax=Paraburkholderia sp. BL9I2N2 TaxID=1938809 RepID=UPI0010DEB860|nr:hypothetical protein [Paraburkholderia sp. BL9I2N2]TCK90838.1 hypothetical protein B0G74_4649 [Paraburkholderia sp. BL9I2N2]